jgi:hypothetical protein
MNIVDRFADVPIGSEKLHIRLVDLADVLAKLVTLAQMARPVSQYLVRR